MGFMLWIQTVVLNSFYKRVAGISRCDMLFVLIRSLD